MKQPSQPASSDQARLQAKPQDDKRIVTPYAFGVADHILGTPLASPFKRAVAIGIDMVLVALLTYVHSLFLAAATAVVLVRVGGKMRRRSRYPRLRKALAAIAGVLVFVVLLGVLETYRISQLPPGEAGKPGSNSQKLQQVGMTLSAMVRAGQMQSDIEAGRCPEPLKCWQGFADSLVPEAMTQLQPKQKAGVTEAIVEFASNTLNPTEQQQLRAYINQSHEPEQATGPSAEKATGSSPTDTNEADLVIPLNSQPSQDETPSLLSWVKGILSDLGLGFGWAALYFTVFGAWWNGQSPGKRIMGIRIVKLDASPMNLWESFGRYGGYGAGFATGLLGFLQLFWDSNRQAIQDKIAETLVIDDRAASRAGPPTMTSANQV